MSVGLVDTHKLHTICESGNCPNMGECWGEGTATFMILGNICTRSCGFCAVATGRPEPVDWDEPQRVAEAIHLMKVKHAVITSVDRDELKDGGSIIWQNTIRAVKALNPDTTLETLIPDFKAEKENIGADHRSRSRRGLPQYRNGRTAHPPGPHPGEILAQHGDTQDTEGRRHAHQVRDHARSRRKKGRSAPDHAGPARQRCRRNHPRPVSPAHQRNISLSSDSSTPTNSPSSKKPGTRWASIMWKAVRWYDPPIIAIGMSSRVMADRNGSAEGDRASIILCSQPHPRSSPLSPLCLALSRPIPAALAKGGLQLRPPSALRPRLSLPGQPRRPALYRLLCLRPAERQAPAFHDPNGDRVTALRRHSSISWNSSRSSSSTPPSFL